METSRSSTSRPRTCRRSGSACEPCLVSEVVVTMAHLTPDEEDALVQRLVEFMLRSRGNLPPISRATCRSVPRQSTYQIRRHRPWRLLVLVLFRARTDCRRRPSSRRVIASRDLEHLAPDRDTDLRALVPCPGSSHYRRCLGGRGTLRERARRDDFDFASSVSPSPTIATRAPSWCRTSPSTTTARTPASRRA